MIRNKFVVYDGSKLHYATTGHGSKHMMIFHGFGQDHNAFDHLTRTLASQYTFYLFDLYFHGSSVWAHGERVLTKQEWRDTIYKFLTENNINRFSLGAFSLGGKFALTTIEFFSERIDEVVLIAPDGIHTNLWYSLATYPTILRRFFKSMIFHRNRFATIANAIHKAGLVDKGLLRFADYQMGTEEKRRRVYYSWVVFRQVKPDLESIVKAINIHSIRLTMVVGRYDNVIVPRKMQKFLKRIRQYRYEEIESGHTGLINQSIHFFIDSSSENDNQR